MRKFNPDKELKRIQYGSKSKVILFVFSLLIVSIISYSFALYQVRYSKRIIYTKVAPFSNKDINILAVYVDGELSAGFPKKNSGYRYDHIVCDKGSTATFDNIKWELVLRAKDKDKCGVYFVKNNEPNVPELYQGLIPVVYDDNGNISVADTNKDWYNYDDKRWANVVLVNNTNYSKYVKDGEYKSNTEIPMSEILQMYVWIPRYKYQLFNAVNGESKPEQEIMIEFESGTLSTGDVKCSISNIGQETCENDQNGNWYTHPAFTFGDTELLGIWVGKFETNGKETALTIKPNITSLRSININTMFNASRNIEEQYADNFNLSKEEIDTHMMKNMEWGAMAYLTQSKYGRCDGAGLCTEISTNGRTDYVTGYNGTAYSWNTANGKLASTTGNIYGIYDTNGGAYEYVMANMVNANGEYYAGSSGLASISNSRYYDVYEYGTSLTDHKRGHLGDATREILKTFGSDTGGWYNDHSRFTEGSSPWLQRSAISSVGAQTGIFAFGRDNGGVLSNKSFRVALTMQDGEE